MLSRCPINFRSIVYYGRCGVCLREQKTLAEVDHWFTQHLNG